MQRVPMLVVLMTACASSGDAPMDDRPAPRTQAPARTSVLYVGPRFLVADGTAAAVLVDAEGRIARQFATPPLEDAIGGVFVQHLPGALALPGLVDAHLHLAWLGRAREELDLTGARSPAEVRARLEAFAAAHPAIAVIVGSGWDQTLWGSEFPAARDLGGLDRPAILSRVDGHAVWLNQAAMERAKGFFLSPPAVTGMRVERLGGAPTGVVVDPPQAFWDLVVPTPTELELQRWIAAGLLRCARAGLVEVHDMATSPAELEALQRLAERGLPVRVVVYLDDSEASFRWLAAHAGGPRDLGPDLQVAGLKLFADGALGSRGAALKADYSDQAGQRGLPASPEELIMKARRAATLGYPVAIHAIGDRGNANALAAIEAANAVRPGLVQRIEHAQVVDPADLERFVTSHAIASMQPTHATSDMRWAEARVGPERIKGAYAWATMLRRGVPLVFGSDAPVEREDPLAGLFAAIFRQTAAGEPPGGWRPSEALTFAEALAAFTVGAAVAAPGAGRTGRLEVGAPFAVTLLDQDVALEPRRLPAAKVLGIVRGARLFME